MSHRKPVALCTLHHKGPLIAPALAGLGYEVCEFNGFDTDTLGTFSGEIPRQRSQQDCALQKAHISSHATGYRFGLGSEGSHHLDDSGLFMLHSEILCWYDNETQQKIFAFAQTPSPLARFCTDSAIPLAEICEFDPAQKWLLPDLQPIEKGVSAAEIMAHARRHKLTEIRVMPDLRAMHCPSRQQAITKCAEDLVTRLSQPCPQCKLPDFVTKEYLSGLPCTQCTTPTSRIRATLKRCDMCHHEQEQPVDAAYADPFYCSWCNP